MIVLRKCRVCEVIAIDDRQLELFVKSKRSKYGRGNICTECNKLKCKEYKQSNREKVYEYNKKYRAENENYFIEYYSDPANRRKKSEYFKEYQRCNRDKYNMLEAERRSRKLLATPSWYDKKEVQYIYALAKERGLHVDHIIPLSHPLVCGLHVQDNLRCISAELNLWKSNKLFEVCDDTTTNR